MRPAPPPAPRLVGVAALVGIAAAILGVAGRSLPGPPATVDPSAWSRWVDAAGPAAATVGLVRALALVGAWYVLAVVALELLPFATAWRPLALLSRCAAPPSVRRAVHAVAGVGLLATLSSPVASPVPLAAPAPAAAAVPAPTSRTSPISGGGAPPPPTMRAAPDEPAPAAVGHQDAGPATTGPSARDTPAPTPPRRGEMAPATAPTMRAVGRAGPAEPVPAAPDLDAGSGDAGVGPAAPRGDDPRAAPPPPTAPTAADPTCTVVAGDSLWRISSRTLATSWGREPSDREVAAYLERLVARNRDELLVPDEPDLIRPGQVFALPPPPAPPRPGGPTG